jgi:hypothetical protein
MVRSEAAMVDDSRARRIFWNTALFLFALILIVLLGDVLFRLLALKPPEIGTLDGAIAYEKIYYRATWAVVVFVCTSLMWFRVLPSVAIVLACVICVELGSLAIHRAMTGTGFNPLPPVVTDRFILHPLLQGIPRPGKFGQYTHTNTNLRFTVNDGKAADAVTIFTYGGSTTYDIGVRDESTWSSHLSKLLGSRFLVENHGVPGYSTVEHIIQASFDFRSMPPKCAIYYVGWNDLRNSNLKDLRADYSDYHLLTQATNLAILPSPNLIKRRSAFISMISNFGTRQIQPNGDVSHDHDGRLSRIYRDNVALIASISIHFGVTPIFVPQVLNYQKLKSQVPTRPTWTPLVIDADVEKLMALMNADLARAAKESGALYLDDVLQVQWTDADFVDKGHFAVAGSQKFAKAISQKVKAACT